MAQKILCQQKNRFPFTLHNEAFGFPRVSFKGGILLANSKSLSFSILIFGSAQERLD
jgi:hypothetical protein